MNRFLHYTRLVTTATVCLVSVSNATDSERGIFHFRNRAV